MCSHLLLSGGVASYVSDSSFESAVPPSTDSDIVSPTSASSQSSLNTPLQEWSAMDTQHAYEYYSVATTADYPKAYHLTA